MTLLQLYFAMALTIGGPTAKKRAVVGISLSSRPGSSNRPGSATMRFSFKTPNTKLALGEYDSAYFRKKVHLNLYLSFDRFE